MRRLSVMFVVLIVAGLFGSASVLAAPPGDISPSPPGQVDRGVVEDISREVRGDTDSFCWKEGVYQWLYYKLTEYCPPKQPLELVLPADEPVDLCINKYNLLVRYTPGTNCYIFESTWTVPDDGPLGICVNAFNPYPVIRQYLGSEDDCEDPFRWWIFYEEIG